MNLQEIAAKLTGLENKFASLTEQRETAHAAAEDLRAELTDALAQIETLTAERDQAGVELAQANSDLTRATARVAELEAERQSAAEQAVDIVAGQGADPAPEAAELDPSQPAEKSADDLRAEMAALPIAERFAFYQKHRDKLNPFS